MSKKGLMRNLTHSSQTVSDPESALLWMSTLLKERAVWRPLVSGESFIHSFIFFIEHLLCVMHHEARMVMFLLSWNLYLLGEI